MDDDSDAIHVTLTAYRSNAKRERVLGFAVHIDDTKKVAILADMIGHSFAMALAKIDFDNPQQQRRKGTSDSPTTVGELPASSEGVTPDLAVEFEIARDAHEQAIAHKYQKICQMRRNDPKFRGFLFDFCKVPRKLNVVEAREWVRQKQHELMKIDSVAKIYPGTYAEKMFEWIESAFMADERNLPIPSMP